MSNCRNKKSEVVWQRLRFYCENCGSPVTVTRSDGGRFGGICGRCKTVYSKTLKNGRQVVTVSAVPEGQQVVVS